MTSSDLTPMRKKDVLITSMKMTVNITLADLREMVTSGRSMILIMVHQEDLPLKAIKDLSSLRRTSTLTMRLIACIHDVVHHQAKDLSEEVVEEVHLLTEEEHLVVATEVHLHVTTWPCTMEHLHLAMAMALLLIEVAIVLKVVTPIVKLLNVLATILAIVSSEWIRCVMSLLKVNVVFQAAVSLLLEVIKNLSAVLLLVDLAMTETPETDLHSIKI